MMVITDSRKDRRSFHVDKRFVNKQGWCTKYALACGYRDIVTIRQTPDPDGITITLWYEPDGFFHVRAHDHELGMRIGWEVFGKLEEARDCFTGMVRAIRERPRADAA